MIYTVLAMMWVITNKGITILQLNNLIKERSDTRREYTHLIDVDNS